jgi:hypothetical protein
LFWLNLIFLSLWMYGHLVGLFGQGISWHKAFTYTGHHNTGKHGHMSMPCRIQTRNPSVQAVKKSICLRPCGHWYGNSALKL